MHPFHAPLRFRRAVRAVVVVLLFAGACTVGEPPEPEAETFEWTRYVNEAVGFAMDVPDVYEADEEAGGRVVLFRTGDGVPVKVYWMTAGEGEGRGLWFGEPPTGTAQLGRREARRYAYRHCDGPLCSRIVAVVVEHRGRELALEFRSDGPLNATNERILASFEIGAETAAGI